MHGGEGGESGGGKGAVDGVFVAAGEGAEEAGVREASGGDGGADRESGEGTGVGRLGEVGDAAGPGGAGDFRCGAAVEEEASG